MLLSSPLHTDQLVDRLNVDGFIELVDKLKSRQAALKSIFEIIFRRNFLQQQQKYFFFCTTFKFSKRHFFEAEKNGTFAKTL